MTRMHDLDDLIGSSDVAEIYGVTRSAVSNWITRAGEAGWDHAVIPMPLAYVGSRPLFSRTEVAEFRQKYTQKMVDQLDHQIAALAKQRRKLVGE